MAETTSSAKFTPGPYSLDPLNPLVIRSDAVGTGYYGAIATVTQRDPHPVHGGGVSQVTAEANAALFVAAPKMHEALLTTRDNIRSLNAARLDRGIAPFDAWLAVIEAALAKAEGR